MAQLAAPEQAKIERDIERALREWSRLPAIEGEFDNWTEDAALDFIFEWSLEEDRLLRLALHAERGDLTANQWKRYRQLSQIVDRHRPIVERLFSGCSPTS